METKEIWKAVQRELGLVDDGEPGNKTALGVASVLGIEIDELSHPADAGADARRLEEGFGKVIFDERSEKNLATLLPEVQRVFREFLVLAKAIGAESGVEVKVISGTRTWKEQDALYAQGRTKPGNRVTNARGGYSNHNFGIAVDLGLFRGGSYLDGDSPSNAARIYKTIAKAANKLGLAWGGDWESFKDPPHFEFPTGYTLAQMRERVKQGKPIV